MRELQQAGRGGGGAYGGGGGAFGNNVGQGTPVTTLGGGGGGGNGGNSGEQPLRSLTLHCISQSCAPAAAQPTFWQLPPLWPMHAPVTQCCSA